LRTYRRERIRCESCETTSGGGAQSQLIPWMRASYIMVAHKAALRYLPDGADINALGYVQLAAWAGPIEQKSGKRLLGFPAGPQGFLEGFLYPSYTGGIVVPFRSEAAEAMRSQFASLWKGVNPNSTSYNFYAAAIALWRRLDRFRSHCPRARRVAAKPD